MIFHHGADAMTAGELEHFEERAAILEYEAGFSRKDAEGRARREIERKRNTTTE